MAPSLTCKHEISDKILVFWSPYFIALQVFDDREEGEYHICKKSIISGSHDFQTGFEEIETTMR